MIEIRSIRPNGMIVKQNCSLNWNFNRKKLKIAISPKGVKLNK
uniref:Uncharacterized protein n=1 Tax=Rhizophora mucronata TaxID=61149 RepID=A0A2P2P505_RHIMU